MRAPRGLNAQNQTDISAAAKYSLDDLPLKVTL